MEISAQGRLYPLKQKRPSPTAEEAWKIIEKHDSIIKITFSNA
ncbi:MAG: hypothetical protein Q7J27_00660 [Syntrophales bacterium]|nr:hypothetical protein [Syntrophales bacterium]